MQNLAQIAQNDGFSPTRELGFFQLLFSDEVLQNLAKFTNGYASEFGQTKISYFIRGRQGWSSPDADEILNFIG